MILHVVYNGIGAYDIAYEMQYIYLLSPSRPLQSNQAVDAHTARAPAREGLIYDIRWCCEIQ